MYFMQNDLPRGTDLIKSGLQILISKMPHEPEGLRRKLLGAKVLISLLIYTLKNDILSLDDQMDEYPGG